MPFWVTAHFIKQSQGGSPPVLSRPLIFLMNGSVPELGLTEAVPAKNCVWGGAWKIEFLSKIAQKLAKSGCRYIIEF